MSIILRDVSKTMLEKKHAFKTIKPFQLGPLTLTIPDKRLTALVGPSGCGKTTLLRLLAGLEKPDQGTIIIGEKTVFDSVQQTWVEPHSRSVAVVFQDFALWPHLRVGENVAFGLKGRLPHQDIASRVKEVLDSVGLLQHINRYPHQLSGGEQQRVALARALAVRPKVMLFDEPLSSLDAHLRESLRLKIKEFVKSLALTAVYVTHDQEEALSMADQIIVMRSGKVEQMDTPEDVYHHPKTTFVAQFIGKCNWITKDISFVRPEDVRLVGMSSSDETSRTVKSRVIDSAFLGDRYRLSVCTSFGQIWIVYSSQPVAPGTEVMLDIPEERIKYVTEGPSPTITAS